ncbi:MAG: SCO family protein [Rhizobacter sp.]|nr:SCO family protein [Rhizobacter sp.]
MPASAQHAEARARRLSAALSLLLLVALAVGLHRWTAGFEVWTFEGRRMLQLQRGELAAQAVPLHTVGPAALWSSGNGAPGAYLVDFIYTRCPSVCRALGSEYQQMQRELAAQPARVRLVSMSFDVAHDTPQQLAAYAATHHADPRWWTLAVPTSDAGAQALLRSLGVVAVDDGQGGFVHNGDLHLLDAHGRLRGLYTLDDWPQALAAARALAAAGTPATRR